MNRDFVRLLREYFLGVVIALTVSGLLAILGTAYAGFGVITSAALGLVFLLLIALAVVLTNKSVALVPTEASHRDSSGLEARQQSFEDYEAAYARDDRAIRNLVIRKESTSSVLSIPEDGTNPFAALDSPDRRLETALRRKAVFRKYIEHGVKLRLILGANPSGLFEKGYDGPAAAMRLNALIGFLQDYESRGNLQIVRRSPGAEPHLVAIYNTDVFIESTPLRQPGRREERTRVVHDHALVNREIQRFDERFDAYKKICLEACHHLGIPAELPEHVRLNRLLRRQLEQELAKFARETAP